MKRETKGIDPKVPTQAIALVIAFLLSYFGIELTPEVSLAIATIVGFFAGYFAPAPKVVEVRKEN